MSDRKEKRTDHNRQKKIAVINDFSGFGRCSIAVCLPVISAMKIQCCPLPTAVFSNHTGFESFFLKDFTDYMEPYAEEWKKLDLRFVGRIQFPIISHYRIHESDTASSVKGLEKSAYDFDLSL